MADNWIDSFAVALGFNVDRASFGEAKKTLADYEAAVKAAEKRIEDARWAGAKTEEEIAKLSRETALKEAKAALADAQAREKAEKEAAQKRQERAKEFMAGMEKMALAATAAATAIGYAVHRVAQSFDNLGFVSQRTGASVQSLNALSYAFRQTGGTASQAVGAVESFTKAMRENSGIKGFVASLGVDMTKDKADQLLDTVRILQKHGYDAGSREAALAGISEENYAHITKYIDELDRYQAEYNKLTDSLGVNSKQATDASMAFQRSMTRLQATASALADKLLVTLAPALQGIVDKIQAWIAANPEKVERIMNDLGKALVWVTEKISAMFENFMGSNGDEFVKRWDEIVKRTERFALAVERVVLGIERLLKMTGLLNREAVPGMGGAVTAYRDWVRDTFGGGAGAAGGASADVPDNRRWYEKILPNSMGGKPSPGRAQIGNWWTPERQQHAIDTLVKGGVSELGAKALVARWSAVEAPGGPTSRNSKGAWGIGQWLTADRRNPIDGNPDFDAQLQHALKELHGPEGEALKALNSAKTNAEAARGASMYERAEGFNRSTGLDNFTDKTAVAMGLLGRQSGQQAGNTAPVNGVGGLEQNQGSAEHRKQALSAVLQQQLIAAAREAGVNVDTFSGGQDPEHQYGSTRHNHGNAADLKLYTLGPDGKRRYLDQTNDADRAVMEKFLRSAVAHGATGIGAGPGYMGGRASMHVGGGSVGAWGAGGSSANAPDWVRRALEFGLEDRKRVGADRAVAPPAKSPVARPNMTPGGFDPNNIPNAHDMLKPAAPMGVTNTNSTANDNRAVHQTFNNNTTINEARNAQEAGRMMGRHFDDMHSLALANAQSAIG